MRKQLVVALLLGFSLLLNLRAQSQRPPSLPSESPRQTVGQKPGAQGNQADDIVRITTNLVQVDVVVTKNGKLVTDLKPEDFEILEDGRPQKISQFSYVSNVPADSVPPSNLAAPPPPKNKRLPAVIPPPIVPAAVLPHDARRTVALVVDDLGVSFESMAVLRDQVRKFLDEQLQPNDLVAIIRTGGYVGALQQFTTDRRLLNRAFERMRWNPCSRTGIGFGSPIGGSQCGDPSAILRATIRSLRFVLQAMRNMPGRKSMVVFTDNLPIREQAPLVLTGSGLQQIFDPQSAMQDASTALYDSPSLVSSLDAIVELAIRGSVVIYAVDTRGLQYPGVTAADAYSRGSINVAPSQYERTGKETENLSMPGTTTIMQSRSQELIQGRMGAQLISERTGGFAIFNSNDFGFTRIMNDQQGYYLIGYRPNEETFNRRFHHIKARVKRRGLTARTREGFYGVTDDEARPPQPTLLDRINAALISPFATNDITVQLTSFFANDPATGPLLRSYLFFDPRNLTFVDQPDGTHEAKFDLNTFVFGDNGRPVRRQIQMLRLKLGAQGYEQALREGVVYPFDLPVQQSGTLQLRVAILDKNSSQIGSAGQVIEVPNLKNKQLALSGIVARDEATLRSRTVAKETMPAEDNDLMIRGPALRRFHQGSVLNLAYEVYNAQLDQATSLPQLSTQLRLYREGKPIYVGNPKPVDIAAQTDPQRIIANARLQLGAELPPGEYVVQIVVEDQLAKEKHRTATQWIDFEVLK